MIIFQIQLLQEQQLRLNHYAKKKRKSQTNPTSLTKMLISMTVSLSSPQLRLFSNCLVFVDQLNPTNRTSQQYGNLSYQGPGRNDQLQPSVRSSYTFQSQIAEVQPPSTGFGVIGGADQIGRPDQPVEFYRFKKQQQQQLIVEMYRDPFDPNTEIKSVRASANSANYAQQVN